MFHHQVSISPVTLSKEHKLQVFINKISKISGQKRMTKVSNFTCYITINLVVLLVLQSQGCWNGLGMYAYRFLEG
jgi:hypothetical protein